MSETATGHDGERYLSIGYEHHNIVLRHAEQKALGDLGFQLRPGTDLKELVGELCAIGLSAQIKSDSQPGTALDAAIRAGASDIMALDADGMMMNSLCSCHRSRATRDLSPQMLVPACRSLSGDGEASNKLLAAEDDERHDCHHKAPPKAQLLDDPDARCLEQFGAEHRGPVGPQGLLD
ncbi:hypothetical protein SAMN02927900_00944 [Rhizobium mongolense subsp. loessense]|uniref:Uncharacterized protein n=1 Tax=Rhizobium mongolense subsp. loessense TaxID=158890 RepID=A0A1G4PTP6_9HYPH|nr:hypothetical protein SAMN02927900_00944 [Rhizobium mongolense subsp. loessense]